MDVVEAANLEVIKKFLESHPDHVFKARKYEDHWVLNICEYDGSVQWQMSGTTFGETAKKLALSLYVWNQSVTGVDGNERSSEN